jgi:hypothetical protein
MMKAVSFSETSVVTRATLRQVREDGILESHRRENLKYYTALTGWALQWRGNVSPVRYELGFYIPDDCIFHSHCRENLNHYIASIISPQHYFKSLTRHQTFFNNLFNSIQPLQMR